MMPSLETIDYQQLHGAWHPATGTQLQSAWHPKQGREQQGARHPVEGDMLAGCAAILWRGNDR